MSTNSRRWLILLFTLLTVVPLANRVKALPLTPSTADKSVVSDASNSLSICPTPVLSRLTRHKVVPGETLASIAQQYNLIPATLMGMNPSLRSGRVTVGSEILIPPYNGIRVEVPTFSTWRNLAAKYQVRADVLFEVNGCQSSPKVVFVPGVNWSPKRPNVAVSSILAGYPLANWTIALAYGWQIQPGTSKVFFHSGLDLLAPVGTEVRAVGVGTVAFAGEQGGYGNLVVINHQGGRQTRYAHLRSILVTVGQTVKQGDQLGTTGSSGSPSSNQPHLHFEVRYASSVGWVAEDPGPFLKR